MGLSRATGELCAKAQARSHHSRWLAPWRIVQVERLLDRIGDAGEPLAIPHVLAFGFDDRKLIARAAGNAVLRLRAIAGAEDLFRIDRLLRDRACWQGFEPRALTAASNPTVLAFAMSHPDGQIRERAVVLVASQRVASHVPLLLLRTRDWVAPVRDLARAAVRARLDLASASHFVAALPLIDGVRDWPRIDGELAHQIEALLRDSRALPVLLAALSSGDRLVRRAAYHRLLGSGDDEAASPYRTADASAQLGVFAAALHDRDAATRRWAAQRMLASPHARVTEHAAALLEIRSVRVAAARRIAERGTLPWLQLLCDRHAPMRALAQRAARALGTDPARSYRALIPKKQGQQLAGALRGLGEVGEAALDHEVVRAHLMAQARRVRRAALQALAQLDVPDLIALCGDALADDDVAYARTARAVLVQRASRLTSKTRADAARLRAIARDAPLGDAALRELLAALDGHQRR